MNIILASSSKSRKKLLHSLKIPFEVIPHQVDEKPFQKRILNPRSLCRILARAKVESVNKKNFWVIGADQMAFLDGQMFGKPKTKAKAFEMLSTLQGKTHELVTALCLQRPNGSYFEDLIINRMTMKPLTKKQIEFYLEKEIPYHCAGSYTIEGLGISLFEKVETSDFNAIIGLPLISLCSQIPIISK